MFAALGRTTTHDEIADTAAQVAKDFAALVHAAATVRAMVEPPTREIMRLRDVIEEVARRFGETTPEEAREHARAGARRLRRLRSHWQQGGV